MEARSLSYTLTTLLCYTPLQVLQRMVTHSQFCMSGDNTIQVHGHGKYGHSK